MQPPEAQHGRARRPVTAARAPGPARPPPRPRPAAAPVTCGASHPPAAEALGARHSARRRLSGRGPGRGRGRAARAGRGRRRARPVRPRLSARGADPAPAPPARRRRRRAAAAAEAAGKCAPLIGCRARGPRPGGSNPRRASGAGRRPRTGSRGAGGPGPRDPRAASDQRRARPAPASRPGARQAAAERRARRLRLRRRERRVLTSRPRVQSLPAALAPRPPRALRSHRHAREAPGPRGGKKAAGSSACPRGPRRAAWGSRGCRAPHAGAPEPCSTDSVVRVTPAPGMGGRAGPAAVRLPAESLQGVGSACPPARPPARLRAGLELVQRGPRSESGIAAPAVAGGGAILARLGWGPGPGV